MLGLNRVGEAIRELAASASALASTLREVNAGLRAHLTLDGAEAGYHDHALPGPTPGPEAADDPAPGKRSRKAS